MTIDLPDKLMLQLKQACPGGTIEAAVETAIRAPLRQQAIRGAIDLAGKFPDFDDSWDEMRHMDHERP
ncbi:MAG: hypothetical protein WEB00_00845 [Dehalococcoidia bacterium]